MEKVTTMAKTQTVVLYPFPGVGQVVPMVQLANLFLSHRFNVTIVLVDPPPGLPDFSGAGFIHRIAASNPAISFHTLPPVFPDAADLTGSTNKNPMVLLLQLMRRYDDALEAFLRSVPRARLHSLITSMFTAHAADVATTLRVPAYTFFAPAATTLAVVTQLPSLLAGRTTSLKELGEAPLEFLGVPAPLPASHLMKAALAHPEEEEFKAMVSAWKRATETHGVLVNTFRSLEDHAVVALVDHRCVPGRTLPPVYCVGPLVRGSSEQTAERHECLAWLDAQPERSVVFLCFGSRGSLAAEQLGEIAVGLEISGQRFLWVLPTVASTDGSKNLDVPLPDGFLERTKDRGVVLRSWAPQVDVLRHPATAAFVTHCGWNSTLEAVTAGVPMLCWPLYAEQMLNKVLITVSMGIGVELVGYREGFIKAEEVETKVRLVMESEEGRELRARVAEYRKQASAAMADGGSSDTAFSRFLSDVESLVQRGGLASDNNFFSPSGI